MASYIKTLKEDNGDITYPQTLGSAVLLSGGADLETELGKFVTAENIASTSALTPPVQTAMIADDAVTPAKASFTKYSTSEQVVGEWIDGSTIYRKTIYTADCGDGGTVSVPHGVSNLSMVVKFEGVLLSSISGQSWPVPMVWDSTTTIRCRADATNVYLNASVGTSVAHDPVYITIYYIKSS